MNWLRICRRCARKLQRWVDKNFFLRSETVKITINKTIQKLLCAYAFPQCIVKNAHPVKLPLCYEDCVATHLQFCYNDWVLIEENKSKNKFIKSRGHFRLPDCNALPKYDKNAKQAKCSYVGLTEIKKDLITRDCRMGNGRYYLGTMNVTNTGLPCQKWAVQSPHEHIRWVLEIL